MQPSPFDWQEQDSYGSWKDAIAEMKRKTSGA